MTSHIRIVNRRCIKILSEKQKRLFNWWREDYETIIAHGAIRSGKTYPMSCAYVMWAMSEFSDKNFIMAAQSITSLKKNVIVNLLSILKNSQKIKFTVKMNGSENFFDVWYLNRKNRFYLYGGAEATSYIAIQGLTAAGAYFDEAPLLNEEFVNQATARCSVEGAKFWFNGNTKEPLHWFKVKWIDDAENMRALVLHFTMDDNPSLSEAKKAEYRRRYKGVFYRRYILGEWCVAEGAIFENWRAESFDWMRMLQKKDSYHRNKYIRLNGFDPGFANDPTAVPAIMLDKETNTLYFYKEIYETGLKTKEIYEKIKEKQLHKEKFTGDSENPRLLEELRDDYGLNITPAKKGKGSVLAGIQKMQSYDIIVHPTCVNTIMEFNSYSWANDKKTNQPINEPVDENNHLMDGARYALEGVDSGFKFG